MRHQTDLQTLERRVALATQIVRRISHAISALSLIGSAALLIGVAAELADQWGN